MYLLQFVLSLHILYLFWKRNLTFLGWVKSVFAHCCLFWSKSPTALYFYCVIVSKLFAGKKKNPVFAWVRLKMCFEIQKKWLNMWKRHFWIVAIARSLFFPILPCMQKVNICSLGHSAAMFGTFVYPVHDMPIGCVCCQLSLLLVDSWHGYCCFFGQFRRSGGTIRSFTTWGTG